MTTLPKRILVPVDFDEPSGHALDQAMELANELNAKVDVLYVWAAPYAEAAISGVDLQLEPHNLFQRVREQCAEQIREFIAPHQAKFSGVELEWFVESGEPRAQVLAHVDERDCDWIVMGTHARHGAKRLWLGSVAEYVVRHANCPVMVVRPKG